MYSYRFGAGSGKPIFKIFMCIYFKNINLRVLIQKRTRSSSNLIDCNNYFNSKVSCLGFLLLEEILKNILVW